MLICRENGRCVPYYGPTVSGKSISCDSMFTVGVDYVYITNNREYGNQYTLREFIEVSVNPALTLVLAGNQDCFDAISKAICIHYFLPCGSNGSIHVPQFVCQDVCSYIEDEVCRNEWPLLVGQIKARLPAVRAIPLALPVCNNTSGIIAPLNLSNDCCSNAGIVVPLKIQSSASSLIDNSLTSRTPSTTLNTSTGTSTITIIGSSIAASVVLLVGISSACLLLLLLWWKKRKSMKEDVSKSERYFN